MVSGGFSGGARHVGKECLEIAGGRGSGQFRRAGVEEKAK